MGRRTLQSLSTTDIEFYINSRLFQYFITIKKVFLEYMDVDIDDEIYAFYSRFVQIQIYNYKCSII